MLCNGEIGQAVNTKAEKQRKNTGQNVPFSKTKRLVEDGDKVAK